MNAIIALDVDGVLYPWLKPEYGRWLTYLADYGELIWATSWEHLANTHIGPEIGLPQLPVIELGLDKIPAVAAYAADRPLVWIDDVFGRAPHAVEWAADRPDTLLIAPDPQIGLLVDHVVYARRWLRGDIPARYGIM